MLAEAETRARSRVNRERSNRFMIEKTCSRSPRPRERCFQLTNTRDFSNSARSCLIVRDKRPSSMPMR